MRPTQRAATVLFVKAADGGYAPRFLSLFLALNFFRFDSVSTLPPTAANAHRWAEKACSPYRENFEILCYQKTMKYPLYIVTGAPGSGKSTALHAFLELHSTYMAFDIDWLAEAASDLAGKDIYSDPSTWKPYGRLWFDVLHAIHKNDRMPVFFTPNDPQDIERYGQPVWCSDIKWLLLDCADQIRRERLVQRLAWTEIMIAEALEDARVLRQSIHLQVDTGVLGPSETAERILKWLEQAQS